MSLLVAQQWQAQWQRACIANYELLERGRAMTYGEIAALTAKEDPTPEEWAIALMWMLDSYAVRRAKKAAKDLTACVRDLVPYQFDGEVHRIVGAAECCKRGYGACGDGSAIVAAVLVHRNDQGAFVPSKHQGNLCYETVDGIPQYAHARVFLDGIPVEPWPDQRRPEARGCTSFDDVSELLNALR